MEVLEVRDKVIVRTMVDQGDDPRYGDIAMPYGVLRASFSNCQLQLYVCTGYGVRGICLSIYLRKNSPESTPE